MSVKQSLCLADVYVGHTQETMIGVICLIGAVILAMIIAGLCMTGMANKRESEEAKQQFRDRGALLTYLGTVLAVWGIAALELSFFDEFGIPGLVLATMALIAWLVKKKKASYILLSAAAVFVMAQPLVEAGEHGAESADTMLGIYIGVTVVVAIVSRWFRRVEKRPAGESKKHEPSVAERIAQAVLYVCLIGLLVSCGGMMVALHSLWYLITQIPAAVFLVISLIKWFGNERRKALILVVIGALLSWWAGALTPLLNDVYETFIYKGRR